MKLFFGIIFILFLISSGFPNFVEGVTNESVCKSTSKDYVQGQGYVLNPEKYEQCVHNFNMQDFWRDARRWGVGLFLLVVIVGIGIIVLKNRSQGAYNQNYSYAPVVRRGWTPDEKEQVRIRQDGKCAHCGKPPPRWEYHHVNGDRSDNSMSNCEGLCPNCHSIETNEG